MQTARRVGTALVLLLVLHDCASIVGRGVAVRIGVSHGATRWGVDAAAAADPRNATVLTAAIAKDPVAFALGALEEPPPGALASSPESWPDLVPDCTAAYLNASVIAAASTTVTTVRIVVPPQRAVTLRGCRTTDTPGAWNVRLVLAMGRSSAVALEGWNVAVGGLTVGSTTGSVPAEALVIVRGQSRIVAGSGAPSGARAGSSDPGDDVHALSVVPGREAAMSGFGIVVMEGSVVQAQHDGPGVLYASACAVRAETSVGGNPGGTRSTLTVERMRVVVAGGSRVEVASTDSSSATYSRAKARRAHAASVQVIPGGVAVVNQFVVAVVVSSVVNASCDDSCAAAGFTAAGRKRGELDIGASDVPTSLTAQRVVLIASGPDSSVALHARGGGRGSSVMGAAAAGATVSLKNATLFVAGPRTSVSLHIRGDGGGRAASVLGVAAHNQGPSNAVAKAEMLDVTALVLGPDTNVSLRVTGGEAGFGVAVLGAASFFGGAVTMLGCSVIVLGPTTKIGIDIADGGNGLGAAVMGAAAASFDSSATMGSTTMYAASPGSSTSLRVAGRGNAATVLGVAGYLEAKLVVQNVAFNAWGPDATIQLAIDDACGCGASALGMSTHLDCTLTGAASTFTRCESRNVAIVVPGGTPSQTAVQDAPGGLGASFSVPTLSECEQFAAPLPVLVRQIDVLATALLLPTATRTRGTATISASQPPTSSRGSPSSGASATGTPLPTERDEVTPRTATIVVAPPPPTAAASTTAVVASIAPPTPPPPPTDPPP